MSSNQIVYHNVYRITIGIALLSAVLRMCNLKERLHNFLHKKVYLGTFLDILPSFIGRSANPSDLNGYIGFYIRL